MRIVLQLGIVAGAIACAWAACNPPMRPQPADRLFVSPAVDSYIASMQPKFKDPQLGQIFANTLPNTLDTTVFKQVPTSTPPDTFIITGDIPAMWLRDSTNQVQPYLRFLEKDNAIQSLVEGLVARQARQVLVDPYANSHQLEGSAPSPHTSDSTTMPAFAGTTVDAMAAHPTVYERKFETDSLSNMLHLAYQLFAVVGKASSVFTQPLNSKQQTWLDAARLAVATLRAQQADTAQEGSSPPYTFQRVTSQPSDSLESGRGAPAKFTGMIKTGFRPSDDAHKLPYNVPGNAYAVVALREAALVLEALGDSATATEARSLAQDAEDGIRAHGIVHHPAANGTVYAYEVDGYGSYYFMDDANLPSLLALPVYGWTNATDPVYQRTRALVLSEHNPWYFSGSVGAGVGGPHVGLGRIWPMSWISQALTTTDEAELATLLSTLVNATGCTGLQHESVWKDSVDNFSRPWFAWANSYFALLVLHVIDTNPGLVLN